MKTEILISLLTVISLEGKQWYNVYVQESKLMYMHVWVGRCIFVSSKHYQYWFFNQILCLAQDLSYPIEK